MGEVEKQDGIEVVIQSMKECLTWLEKNTKCSLFDTCLFGASLPTLCASCRAKKSLTVAIQALLIEEFSKPIGDFKNESR